MMADLAEDHENQLKYLRCGHSDHLLKSINRLRKERKLCDITLKVGEKEFFAHRVILSACSDYFCAMFTGNMEESHKSVVELHGLDSDTMEFILDFVYTETIQVSVENVQALLPAACLLQLTGLSNSSDQDILSPYQINTISSRKVIRIPRFNKKFPVHEHVPWNENCGKDSVFFLFRSWIF